ncbi:hypothetical protein VTO58DRAFT_103909 [Aureobasidium pullulans]
MAGLRILITGASGYIGGSVVTTILKSDAASLKNAEIVTLVRKQEQASVLEQLGLSSLLFRGLDDVKFLQSTAKDFDIVINNASASHAASAAALIRGLADRKQQSGKDVFYIHTSGISSIADHPITGTYHEHRIFNDIDGDIYEYQKQREAQTPYIQRTTDITVIEEAEKHNVPAIIIMAPTIFGKGIGPLNKVSIQIPEMIRSALKQGQSEVVGDGKAVWSNVHIEDLMDLYEIIIQKVAGKDDIPNGRRGIYFASTAVASWREIAEKIGVVCKAQGKLSTEHVKSISLEDAAEKWTAGSLQYAEVAYSSNARTRSVEVDFGLINGL